MVRTVERAPASRNGRKANGAAAEDRSAPASTADTAALDELLHALDLMAVAEGVESPAQEAKLVQLACAWPRATCGALPSPPGGDEALPRILAAAPLHEGGGAHRVGAGT